jgi:hypothetical protein
MTILKRVFRKPLGAPGRVRVVNGQVRLEFRNPCFRTIFFQNIRIRNCRPVPGKGHKNLVCVLDVASLIN